MRGFRRADRSGAGYVGALVGVLLGTIALTLAIVVVLVELNIAFGGPSLP